MHDVRINQPVMMRPEVCGYFLLEAFKVARDSNGLPYRDHNGNMIEIPGSRRTLCPWQKNRILNLGKNGMAQQSFWLDYCHVGSGQNVAQVTDTQLQTFVAATNSKQETLNGAQGQIPYYGWKRTRWRFTEGAAAGNLNEVGVGWGASGQTLICRHRLVNANGIYATITVQSDELLDVTYEFRLYPPLDDVSQTNSITLDGTNYDTVTRALNVTSGTIWGSRLGNDVGIYAPSTSTMRGYTGDLTSITGTEPGGTAINADGPTHFSEAYVADSYQRVHVGNVGSGGWNGNLRCITMQSEFGKYQTRFGSNPGDNTIPKTALYSMQIKWLLAWAESIKILGVPATFSFTGIDADLNHIVP